MTTSFDSPLELQQIVDAAEPGRVTPPDQPATRPARLAGGGGG